MVCFVWFLVEVIFYIWHCCELRHAQRLTTPPKHSWEELNTIFQHMLEGAEEYGMWRQIEGWFLATGNTSTNPHAVGHEDIDDLLAWAFFYKRFEDLDAEEVAWTQGIKPHIEASLGERLVPGRANVKIVRHTMDEVQAIPRPLIFYIGVQLMNWSTGLILRVRGFHHYRVGHARYWCRLPVDVNTDQTETIVFFHGIGLGLPLYLPLLTRLGAGRQILFELPWISMNPFTRSPSSAEYTRDIVEVLDRHCVQKCILVSHSFGSIPGSWLIRHHSDRISRAVFVDPVSMLLNLPDVCLKFLYKKPRSISGKVMRLFGARELGIARTLMRNFFWTENVLFPSMLPAGSSVILMGEDCLLPVREIYMCSCGAGKLNTVVMPGLNHGHFLIWPSTVGTILEHVKGNAVCT